MTEVAHVTRDSDTSFKVKGLLVADVLNSKHAGIGATWQNRNKYEDIVNLQGAEAYDDLLNELVMNGIGCHVCNQYFGCIMYADDLLSASVSGLQRMLDICYRFGMQNSIAFNQNKSVYPSWLARTSTSPLHN